MENAEKLVEYAKTQIGQYGKKYMDWAGYSDPWCSEFVSYCADKCGFIKDGLMPMAGNCRQAQDFYNSKGLLHRKQSYSPKSGDIVFFGKDGTDHTAIVESVNGKDMTVIEGNAGDSDYRKSRVCRTVYKLTDSWLWGFANPLAQIIRKRCDMTTELEKLGKSYAKGMIATADGVDYILPKKCTAILLTAHNSTASLNSMWMLNLANDKAVKLSGHGVTLTVKIREHSIVTVKTEQGNPRTYWTVLES